MARKTDLQSFMRFVFQEALTEKIGSQVLDKAKIGINYVRKFMLGREKFQSDRPHVWLPALILSPEDKKKKRSSFMVFVPLPEAGYLYIIREEDPSEKSRDAVSFRVGYVRMPQHTICKSLQLKTTKVYFLITHFVSRWLVGISLYLICCWSLSQRQT